MFVLHQTRVLKRSVRFMCALNVQSQLRFTPLANLRLRQVLGTGFPA